MYSTEVLSDGLSGGRVGVESESSVGTTFVVL